MKDRGIVQTGLTLCASVVFLGLLVIQFGMPIYAQSNCPYPPISASGAREAWAQNAGVAVNIDPRFSAAQRDGIVQAFTNWQNANGAVGNQSGVTFTFTYNSTPQTGSNTFQVNYQTPAQVDPNQSGRATTALSQGSSSLSRKDCGEM